MSKRHVLHKVYSREANKKKVAQKLLYKCLRKVFRNYKSIINFSSLLRNSNFVQRGERRETIFPKKIFPTFYTFSLVFFLWTLVVIQNMSSALSEFHKQLLVTQVTTSYTLVQRFSPSYFSKINTQVVRTHMSVSVPKCTLVN